MNECEGCILYKDKDLNYYCFSQDKPDLKKECPCKDCLIKTMCSILCDERVLFVDKILADIHKERYGL